MQGPDGNQQRVLKTGNNGASGYGTVPQPNVHQGQNGSWGVGGQTGGVVVNGAGLASAGESSSRPNEAGNGPVPPSYADAVKGDNKVQH